MNIIYYKELLHMLYEKQSLFSLNSNAVGLRYYLH